MSGLTDFNDLAVACGLSEVARQIMAAVNQTPAPMASNDDIAPADKAIADQQQKDLNAMLQRYAKIMAPGRATNKVYDLQQKVEYTKTQFNDHIGNKAIAKTEDFFRSLGLTTRLNEEQIGESTINEIEKRFAERNVAYGENGKVTAAVARQILESCL